MKIDDIVIGKEYIMFIDYQICDMDNKCTKCIAIGRPFETHDQQYKYYANSPYISVETSNGMYMYQNASFQRFMQQNGGWMRETIQVKYEDGTTHKLNCGHIYELVTEYEPCNVYWILHEGELIQSMLLSVDSDIFKFAINKTPTIVSKDDIKLKAQ
jgi:hypothetical protein